MVMVLLFLQHLKNFFGFGNYLMCLLLWHLMILHSRFQGLMFLRRNISSSDAWYVHSDACVGWYWLSVYAHVCPVTCSLVLYIRNDESIIWKSDIFFFFFKRFIFLFFLFLITLWVYFLFFFGNWKYIFLYENHLNFFLSLFFYLII